LAAPLDARLDLYFVMVLRRICVISPEFIPVASWRRCLINYLTIVFTVHSLKILAKSGII